MSTSRNNVVVAFDAYGTLLSTESIAEKLATHFGAAKAQTIAATWRKYQLEYTWRLNSMNQYEPFSSVTKNALHHALAEARESLSDAAVDAMLDAYDALSVFADVPGCLRALASSPAITPVVFSNGTRAMVANSVQRSPDLAPLASVFADIVVVEPARRYKPHPAVYEHLAARVGKGVEQRGDVWVVSGNPFDIVGARAAGMKAAWVDRQGGGWQDRLGGQQQWAPTVVLRSLEELPAVVVLQTGGG
ncbi:haloacid dehalogenase, type II [Phyllosticta paracitricarpa]|uniref:Haloacid dehalogenase, type II n=1 Tax=Phyllosticta paracitricarpa TaxID=2016321 RepID=A0ABR1N5E2_9PEZI